MSKKNDGKKPKQKQFEAQIVTLGDSQVGKTSLILRYTDNSFTQEYLATIGFDLKLKKLTLPNGEEIRVKISDTAGQERFKSIATNYLKKANGVILAYDVTKETSFENIDNWVEQINAESGVSRPIILIGNKCDLTDKRVISKEKGEQLAQKTLGGIKFYETSCKTGENVENAIDDLVYQIYNKYSGKNANEEGNIKIEKEEKGGAKKKKCC